MKAVNVMMLGAWGRNYGDRAIQSALSTALLNVFGTLPVSRVTYDYADIQAGPADDALIERINRADLLVVGGGGLLWNKPELRSRSGWQWDVTLTQLERIRTPIAVFGIGCTRFPFKDDTGDIPAFTDTISWLLDHAIYFGVRNTGTKQWLQERIPGAVPSLVPDPATFLWPQSYRPEGLEPDPVIGVCWASDKPDWRYGSGEAYGRFLEQSAYGIALGAKEQGAQVLFIEHIAEMEAQARNVFRDHCRAFGVPFFSIEELWPWLYPAVAEEATTLFAAYKHCDMVFSVRKHGLIVPAARGKPVVGLGDVPELHWLQESPWWPVPKRMASARSTYLETALTRYCQLADGLTPLEAEQYRERIGYGRGVFDSALRTVAQAAL